MTVEIIKAGMLTTVQDRGRIGHSALGVARSGPMDVTLFRLANALVGNDADAAALEITLIGPKLRLRRSCTLALCGDFSRAMADGVALPAWRTLHLDAGTLLDCGALTSGTRGYLAVSGGFDVEPVLGSRATDINGKLGPGGGRSLQAGDVLPLGVPQAIKRGLAKWSLDPMPWFDTDPSQPVHCVDGTHRDALDLASLQALQRSEFFISSDSNRVGLRLDGPTLQLRAALELISEPVGFGTMQLPPGGQPIVLMSEHPTTGGYPRIGQIAAIDLGRLAQRRPGERLRLAAITLSEAQARYRRLQQQLGVLIGAIHERLYA